VPFLGIPREPDAWLAFPWEECAFLAGSCGEEEEEASFAILEDRWVSCSTWEARDGSDDRGFGDGSSDW